MGIFWLLLDCLVTVILSALSGMGVGGGSLLLMYLTELRGVETTVARGVNLLCFLLSGLAALPIYLRTGLIRTDKQFWLFVIPGLFAVFFGSYLAAGISPVWIRKLFGAFLIFTALLFFIRRKNKTEK